MKVTITFSDLDETEASILMQQVQTKVSLVRADESQHEPVAEAVASNVAAPISEPEPEPEPEAKKAPPPPPAPKRVKPPASAQESEEFTESDSNGGIKHPMAKVTKLKDIYKYVIEEEGVDDVDEFVERMLELKSSNAIPHLATCERLDTRAKRGFLRLTEGAE